MIASLGYLFLVGLAMADICRHIRLPRIVGLLFTGIVLGPYVLDVLDPALLGLSSQLRQMALIIILLKAGLALNVRDLKAVGRPALLLSCLPATFEMLAFVMFAPAILHVTFLEAALMGSVLGAVSPAVVVPKMVQLMEEGYGVKQRVPQLILAGSSLDDVFVIVLFTALVGLCQSQSLSLLTFASIPVSIVCGVVLGLLFGWGLHWLFTKRQSAQPGLAILAILGCAFLLVSAEDWLEGRVPMSGLLAVMSMACALQMKQPAKSVQGFSRRFGEIWLAAEVLLFSLVGAAVDLRYTLEAGIAAIGLLFLALVFRSAGVWLSLLGTRLTYRERLFCIIAYLPKATVQAAIGGVPLALGLPCGKLVLSVAVLSILITAPLGAWGMDVTYKRLLTKACS